MAKGFELNRRQFLGAAGLAAAGVAAAGVLSSCSSEESASAESSESSDEESSVPAAPDSVDETVDCDLLVIGAGIAGLAACVEAGESGVDTICIEAADSAGGNGNIVEGVFGAGSQMAKDAGLEVDIGDFVRREIFWGHYRIDGRLYNDLIPRTGENIDWLVDHGVEFGQVYNQGIGYTMTFHEFTSGHGADSYVPFMQSAAEDAGVKFEFNTKADSFIQDDSGAVTGVYATQDGDKAVQYNAKAVMLATGGWMADEDRQRKVGLNPNILKYLGQDTADGSGHDMAVAIGVGDNSEKASPQYFPGVVGLPNNFEGGAFCPMITAGAPYAIWVNQDGERFVNEDIGLAANDTTSIFDPGIPAQLQDDVYVILDQSMVDMYIGSVGGDAAQDELDQGLDSGEIVKADTIEELADAVGFDKDLFSENIEIYNQSCADGADSQYGKYKENIIMFEMPVDSLVAFENAPYYAFHMVYNFCGITGSLCTNRDFQAVDADKKTIEHLYVIGSEGVMLWANAYNTYAGGSCSASGVDSGRMAVKHAIDNYL